MTILPTLLLHMRCVFTCICHVNPTFDTANDTSEVSSGFSAAAGEIFPGSFH